MTVLHFTGRRATAPAAPKPTTAAKPAPTPRQAPPFGHDASRPAQHTAALNAAWRQGCAHGEQLGHVSAWRWGFACGVVCTLLLAGCALAVAEHWGWL